MPTGAAAYDPNKIINSQPRVDDSVAAQVTKLSAQDSALNQMARTEGLKAANRRGLLNSSMAIGASQEAVLKNVLPIAQQESGQAFAQNQAARAFEYGLTGQEAQQRWQTGERLGGQEFAGTQAQLDRDLQQSLQDQQITSAQFQQLRQIEATQGIEAANRELSRFLQASQQQFESAESLASRGWQTAENIAQRGFLGTQAELDRDLQDMLQSRQITSAEFQQANQIRSTEGIEEANRFLAETLQARQQEFQGQQAGFDRELQQALQSQQIDEAQRAQLAQIASVEGIEAARNALATSLQESEQTFQSGMQAMQQAFESGENTAARGWQTLENLNQRGFLANQAELDRTLQSTMQFNQISADDAAQIRQIAATGDLANAQIALQERLQENDIQFRMTEGGLDRASAERQQQADIAFQTQNAALNRSLQAQIAQWNLSSTNQQAASGMVGQNAAIYQDAINNIMANTSLTAAQRTQQITEARNRFDTQMNLAEQMYNVDLTWNAPAPAAAPAPAPAPAAAPAPARTAAAPTSTAPRPTTTAPRPTAQQYVGGGLGNR